MGLEDKEIFYNCGQKFYILDKDKWELIIKIKKFEEVEINSLTVQQIDKQMKFVERNPEFVCALTKQRIGNSKTASIPFVFYKLNQSWQRVALEFTECTKCGWSGSIANPTLSYLYEMIPERFELIARSFELKQVGCPKCNSKLERFAIWAELQ